MKPPNLTFVFVALAFGVCAEEVVDRERIVSELSEEARAGSTSRSIAVEAVTPPVRPSAYTTTSLPAIRFEYDSARLTERALDQLAELGAALEIAPLSQYRFAIQGHTDSIGDASYNRSLSLRRAQSVTSHLAGRLRIESKRLIAVGVGEDLPLAGTNADDPRNRRVEVISLGSGSVAYPTKPANESTNDPPARALLIGIDSYPNVSNLLGAPVNDVEAVRQYVLDELAYRPEEVRALVNQEATRDGILGALRWALSGAGRALIYFSGHGFRQRDENDDEADGWDETLVPFDVSVEGGVAKGMITDDEIGELLTGWSGKALEVVIDACHSGTLTRGLGVDHRLVKSPRLPDGSPLGIATRGMNGPTGADSETFVESENPTMAVWTAVRADQKALVDVSTAPRYLSVFTRRLLAGAEGIADTDGDGSVTARELNAHVRSESSAYCEQNSEYCGAGLSPELSISSSAFDRPAFAGQVLPLPRIASLAKDILVSPSAPVEGIGNVRLHLDPGTQLRVGDEIEVTAESDSGGALVLLDIDARGRVTQVFPNDRSLASGMSGVIRENVAVRVPGAAANFRFRARPPLGRGILVAVVAEGESGLASLTGRHKDLSVIPRPEAYVVELAGHLRRWTDGKWSYGQLAYEVAEE